MADSHKVGQITKIMAVEYSAIILIPYPVDW